MIARATASRSPTPRSASTTCSTRNPGLDRGLAKAELAAVLPAFTAGADRFGELDPARLRAWAAWDVRFGILTRPPDVARAFDRRFLP